MTLARPSLFGRLRRARRSRRDGFGRDGSAAVEFALILPVLLLFLFGIVQFGFLFSVYNTMVHAAREGARGMAVEQLTAAEGEALVQTRLAAYANLPFTVDATEPDPTDPADLDVVVEISVPLEQAMLVDALGLVDGGTLDTQIVMRRE